MIDHVDHRLADWARGVVGDEVDISFQPPREGNDPLVTLYLLDILNRPATGTGRAVPHQILLRYVVTTAAKDEARAHSLLGQLVFAALEDSGLEVEQDPLPLELWISLGTIPRPAFVLRVPLKKPRPERSVRPVRQPLQLKQASLAEVVGLVQGPGAVPIVGARVELPGLRRHTRTDARGRFRFTGVPEDPRPTKLLVMAKGKSEVIRWEEGMPLDEPLAIHLELEG
jgi:hypothetical protein